MKKSILILLLFSSTFISANTITVTNGASSGAGTLDEAITNAAPNDTINFDVNVTTVSVNVLFLRKNITIIGSATNNTTIIAVQLRHFHLVENTNITVYLNNLTFKNGNATGSCGGAIYNKEGNTLILNNCIFENNTAGSGAAVDNTRGNLTINNCVFRNNIPSYSGAGTVANTKFGSLTINNCVFENNTNSDITAGVGAISNRGEMFVNKSTFINNSGSYTGAIYNGSAEAIITVRDCIFMGNKGDESSVFKNEGVATIINSLFVSNKFYRFNHSYYPYYTRSGTIANKNNGSITVVNSTIVNNEGSNDGLFNSETATLYNNIIWNNGTNDVYNVTTAYYNLIGTSDTDLSGNGNIIGINPSFVSSSDYNLQAGSPAKNTGNNSYIPVGITEDLAGNLRVSNGIVDMGAYEYQYYYTVIFAGEDINIPTQTIEDGGFAARPEEQTRENYTFGGWFTDSGTFVNEWDFDNSMVTQDTTLYAKWDTITVPTQYHTVTFAGESINISSQTVEHGKFINKPADPQRANYSFGGWFTDNSTFNNQWNFANDVVISDITLFSKWDSIIIPPQKYTVTFTGENINIPKQTIEHGKLVSKPADPQRTNYSFVGWFTDNGTFANQWDFASDVVTSNMTLYAKWNAVVKNVPVTGISFRYKEGVVFNNKPFTLEVNVSPSNATNKNVIISSENTSILTVDENNFIKAISKGEAYIIATSEDGGFKDSCKIFVRSVTNVGVSTFVEVNGVEVYPNPVKDVLHVRLGKVGIVDYSICDILGQVVTLGTLKGDTTINVETLANGLYFLRIAGKTVKIIKN